LSRRHEHRGCAASSHGLRGHEEPYIDACAAPFVFYCRQAQTVAPVVCSRLTVEIRSGRVRCGTCRKPGSVISPELVIHGPTAGRRWEPSAARKQLDRAAAPDERLA
jgi:hypothetical protein